MRRMPVQTQKYPLAPAFYHLLWTSISSEDVAWQYSPHSSAHTGDSSTQCPTLPSHPVVHLVGTGDVVLVVLLALAGQTNDTGSVPANLWSGDRPFYRAMVERRDGPSWLCDDNDNDDDISAALWCYIIYYIGPTLSVLHTRCTECH